MTPKEQMIAQLMKQKLSKNEAAKKVSEIERNQLLNHYDKYRNQPLTVGSYFKKNRKKCLEKFSKK